MLTISELQNFVFFLPKPCDIKWGSIQKEMNRNGTQTDTCSKVQLHNKQETAVFCV